ncbi:MAG: hypothetical protein KDA96_25620 [Planctomycetaceae bacterium]|nr:hypothetical protein [Planctomycetaceae bacterium]MCA9066483.1 hypothetical protein [Planctomycetaceae bacterium]
MSKRTTGKKKSKTTGHQSTNRLVDWFFRPSHLIISAVFGLCLVCYPVFRHYLPSLTERPEYQLGPEQVTITSPPRWIPPDLIQQAFQRAGFRSQESLLDETLSERVALAFYTHPWIEDVRSVRKSYPPRLHVEVVYRVPVAMVSGVDGYYPVDRHGVLLPPGDFSVADIARYPHIDRVSSVPLGNVGEPWGDPAVIGAAELAAVLQQSAGEKDGQPQPVWRALGIESVLAPRSVAMDEDAEHLEYRLRTTGGTQIVWGRTPSTQHPGELSVEQKLARLTDYLAGYGAFDDAHGPYEIDIRPWHGIGRGLLAAEQRDDITRN